MTIEKLNKEALKADSAIKAHEAGISYAKGRLMESASKVKLTAEKEISKLKVLSDKATALIRKYGV